MISGICDLYVLCLGMIYPAYQMLQQRENAEQQHHWYQYWTVFSIAYVSSEFLEASFYMMIPLVTLMQVVGVTLLIIPTGPTSAQRIYSNVLIPFYETHKSFIHENVIHNSITKKFSDYVAGLGDVLNFFKFESSL